ncbi:MAG: type I restriction-modification system methyltransferase subunit [Parcubacteria group bacterium Athens1014_26]|nr:MAG: type I restriction-modification system methyltransferase subunit [Parcubacteria group bacterium Athens1014_26]
MDKKLTSEILKEIFRNPDAQYGLAVFSDLKLDEVLNIFEKEKGKYYLKCLKRDKDIVVYNKDKNAGKPEEIVRQLMIYRLTNNYKYPLERIGVEVDVQFGRDISSKRADIVIYREDLQTPYLIIEVKKPDVKDGLGQLKSYANATGAPILVLTDGKIQNNILRTDPNLFEDLLEIPKFNETVEDVRSKKITYQDLDEILNLKQLIFDLQEVVLANSGVDAFDEIFKLVYAKLYDEIETPRNENRRFRVIAGATNKENLNNLSRLFEDAKSQWRDVFKQNDELEIPENVVVPAVSLLQKYRLFGSNLQIIDDAFEYLINLDAKGEKGQYFTPRHVIDMAVKMLSPKSKEFIIDTAAGSCGFLLHAMQYVWDNEINKEKYGENYKSKQKDYAEKHLFGIDFDPRSVKIGKAMMLIAGDGKTNVTYANSLDSDLWNEEAKTKFRPFLRVLKDREENRKNQEKMADFNFDVLLTNPPFAGEIKGVILNKYDLGFKYDKNFDKTSKHQNEVSRDILFIERNLSFLRPGGRMAIVLPQGVFNNSNSEYVRRFILDKARILAVVGLDTNTFKPHTGTKTSVLFLQKWGEDEKVPKDYSIFMAVSKKGGKDSSGDYVYKKDKDGNIQYDEKGKKVIDHDLDEIAEEFIKFTKEQKFNFMQ